MRDYENAGIKDKPTVQCSLVPLQQQETADIRQPLLMLWGAVGLVLLIACVNIAGLLLARSGSRTREIATRMALGSGRPAVIRQLLVESALLALGGGALGLMVSYWSNAALVRSLSALFRSMNFSLAVNLHPDAVVLAVTFLVCLVATLLFS